MDVLLETIGEAMSVYQAEYLAARLAQEQLPAAQRDPGFAVPLTRQFIKTALVLLGATLPNDVPAAGSDGSQLVQMLLPAVFEWATPEYYIDDEDEENEDDKEENNQPAPIARPLIGMMSGDEFIATLRRQIGEPGF